MTDLRKRGPEGTLQRRVFLILRETSSAADRLATLTGTEREIARKAADYLVQRGLATKHILAPRLVIYAAVPRKHPPEDRRGKPAACRNHRGQAAFAKWLLMMRAKHGPRWRPKAKSHPLENWRTA